VPSHIAPFRASPGEGMELAVARGRPSLVRLTAAHDPNFSAGLDRRPGL